VFPCPGDPTRVGKCLAHAAEHEADLRIVVERVRWNLHTGIRYTLGVGAAIACPLHNAFTLFGGQRMQERIPLEARRLPEAFHRIEIGTLRGGRHRDAVGAVGDDPYPDELRTAQMHHRLEDASDADGERTVQFRMIERACGGERSIGHPAQPLVRIANGGNAL